MRLTDTHSHVYLPEFDNDCGEVLQRAFDSGIERILMPNVDGETFDSMLSLCRRYPLQCFPMIGLHPTSVKEDGEEALRAVLNRKNEYPFCAVGEIGIDLYWDKTFLTQQIAVFEEQLRLSIEWNLPVVIHSREAHAHIIKSIERVGKSRLRGVFHSFGGSAADLEEILGLGNFLVGINGVVTFKNSSLPETLRSASPRRIVFETDAPYLAPVPYRGKRNEPAYIWETARCVAGIFDMPLLDLLDIAEQNVQTMFDTTFTSDKT